MEMLKNTWKYMETTQNYISPATLRIHAKIHENHPVAHEKGAIGIFGDAKESFVALSSHTHVSKNKQHFPILRKKRKKNTSEDFGRGI